MSTEDNATQEEIVKTEETNPPVDSSPSSGGGFISSFLSLKETNPKVFFGSIGGIVVLLVLMMSMGGSSSKPPITGPVLKDLVIGQQYTLKSANSYDPSATVRLVGTPGGKAPWISPVPSARNRDSRGRRIYTLLHSMMDSL